MQKKCSSLWFGALVLGGLLASSAYAAPVGKVAYAVSGTIALGNASKWDYLAVDEQHRRLFVSGGDHVNVIDLANGRVGGVINATRGVHGIALAPDLGLGFTSNGKADSVTVFDLVTLAVLEEVPVGGKNPDAVLYDQNTHYLLTFNGKSKDMSVLDAQTRKPVGTIALGGRPEFAVSDGKGNIFVNIEDKAELVSVSLNEKRVLARWSLDGCDEPTGLAFDQDHQRLFSVCQNQVMAVTDALTGKQVARVAIGSHPDAAVYDAALGVVLVSNGDKGGTLSVVQQLDADHYRSQEVQTQAGAKTMAFDHTDKKAYLPYVKDKQMYVMVMQPVK